MKTNFDKIYASQKKNIYGSKPDEIVVKSIKHVKGKDVLDLGAGEGRNSVFLTKKKFNVLAVDSSNIGLFKLRRNAGNEKVKIQTKHGLIENFNYPKKYSAILSTFVLNFVKKKEIKKTIKKIKENTLDGGVNVITVLTTDDPGFKRDPKRLKYFKKNELKNFYNDWKIKFYDERTTPLEKHGNGKWHRHGVAGIIAVKKVN